MFNIFEEKELNQEIDKVARTGRYLNEKQRKQKKKDTKELLRFAGKEDGVLRA